jgi:hypothetical protein
MKFRAFSVNILLTALIFAGSALAAGPTAKVLYRFHGQTDGANPYGNLIADQAGNLYGTTEYGGPAGYYGTVFELTSHDHSRRCVERVYALQLRQHGRWGATDGRSDLRQQGESLRNYRR